MLSLILYFAENYWAKEQYWQKTKQKNQTAVIRFCINCNSQGWVEKFIGWKVHTMMLYLLLMTFFTNGIQARQLKVCGHEGGLCWKIILICSPSLKVSWSAYELFIRPLYIWNVVMHCSFGVQTVFVSSNAVFFFSHEVTTFILKIIFSFLMIF